MPTTINVGLSKKLGLPDFGSVGATCNVTFEADHNLLDRDLEGFQQRVKNAFAACRDAVQNQLAREINASAGNDHGGAMPEPTKAANGANGNNGNDAGASNNYANGNGSNGNGHGASEKQLAFARQLAKAIQGLGIRRLETLAQRIFGKPLAAMTSLDASGLIDTLKSVKDGKIDLNSIVSRAAA